MRRQVRDWTNALFRRGVALEHGRVHYQQSDGGGGGVRNRLVLAGLSLVVVFILGTGGYYVIGRQAWSLEDCAYMVLITITTVGYAEVLPVHTTGEGRLFTMFLLVSGMGVSFYFLSALTAFIIEGDLREALWRRRMTRKLARFDKHHIVCGAGRTGRYVVDELVRSDHQVVVIERDPEQLNRLAQKHGDSVVILVGDATDDGVLKDAGVLRAAGLVAALQLDQDNLFVALSARQLNATMRIVSRANAERAEPKLRQAGADAVVSPTNIGGRRMAHELLRPNAVGFLDIMSQDMRQNLDIEQIEIPEGSPLHGRTLRKSNIREVSSALVLAVITDGVHTYNPPSDFELRAGMVLVLLGEVAQIAKLQQYLYG
jgi:voltage-gated potassium channel